jgi:hypothetical protein
LIAAHPAAAGNNATKHKEHNAAGTMLLITLNSAATTSAFTDPTIVLCAEAQRKPATMVGL